MSKEEAELKAIKLVEKLKELLPATRIIHYCNEEDKIWQVQVRGKDDFGYAYQDRGIPPAGVKVEYRKCNGWQLGYSMGEEHANGKLLVTNYRDRIGGMGQGVYVDEWRPLKTKVVSKDNNYYSDKFDIFCNKHGCDNCPYTKNKYSNCAVIFILDIIKKENNQ